MRTGEVVASLPELNAEVELPYVDALVALKTAGAEHEALTGADADFHRAEFLRLCGVLADAAERSRLPETAPAETRAALHDLLLRVRLGEARAAA